jgi:phage gp29-like protein
MAILDQFGHPIRPGDLAEPQTARLGAWVHRTLSPALTGLSPSRLAAALHAADHGNLLEQHRLFADMEGRDAHLAAEMGKRKNALIGLAWDIVPPRNATPAEEAAAEWVEEVLEDAIDPLEDLIAFLMEAIGHGFACAELAWKKQDGAWLPTYHPRPQEWFCLDAATRSELRLTDTSADGQALRPFGWCWHVPGKAKTGYMGRMGLYRALVWPFLYKSYALGDFAEFLETYGLPIITGKYFNGASADEKASLLRAVSALGHDARAIMPQEMTVEIEKVSGSGDDLHLRMVEWADKSTSKLVLGGTLTSQADGKTSTNALGNVHNEVRHDILISDARQIAATLTRDLIYPLIALNRGGIDSLRRCPRLVFDTSEPEDVSIFADALPKLVSAGMATIPLAWVHEKLKIPQAEGNEPVLGMPAAAKTEAKTPPAVAVASDKAALSAQPAVSASDVPPDQALADQLARSAQPLMEDLIGAVSKMVGAANDLPSLQSALLNAYGDLDTAQLSALMAAAFALAELKGMATVIEEAGLPPAVALAAVSPAPPPATPAGWKAATRNLPASTG